MSKDFDDYNFYLGPPENFNKSKPRSIGGSPHKAKTPKQRLAEWHNFLTSKKAENYPSYIDFECKWQLIGAYPPERGEDVIKNDTGPLAALFEYIEGGFYPPPELLLTLLDLWKIYRTDNYKLEEVFIGSGKPKAGNAVKIQETQLIRFQMAQDLLREARICGSLNKAAEKIAEAWGMDQDTLLRTVRKERKQNQYIALAWDLFESSKKAD